MSVLQWGLSALQGRFVSSSCARRYLGFECIRRFTPSSCPLNFFPDLVDRTLGHDWYERPRYLTNPILFCAGIYQTPNHYQNFFAFLLYLLAFQFRPFGACLKTKKLLQRFLWGIPKSQQGTKKRSVPIWTALSLPWLLRNLCQISF